MFFTMAKGSSDFKRKRSLEERKAEFAHVREKYPDRVPVIVEKVKGSDTPDMRRKRFLVPKDSNVGQFVYVIRKKLKLSPEKAIFVFVNDTLPSTAALVSTIYEQNKDEDGFLYMTYSSENTFGFCKENFKSVALF